MLVDDGAPARRVLVAFTDRVGGTSEGGYRSLNLALRVGDRRSAVEENRRRVAAALGFQPSALALARQVHGAEVLHVEPGASGVLGEADVLTARSPGPVLAVLTADCAPVALAGERGIAMVHAGWRGLVAGAVERGVAAVGPVWGAWVGPSIHACCYQVGSEVTDAFERSGLPVAGSGRVDPGRAAAFALHRAGVERVAASHECTSCDERYFSYRRDGVTGRQAGLVALLPPDPSQ